MKTRAETLIALAEEKLLAVHAVCRHSELAAARPNMIKRGCKCTNVMSGKKS